MARFYARFDSGSSGWVTTLDNDYFERRRIGASSASAAPLRTGLIASRSAVSTDVYADLPISYENGALGTIIPGAVLTTDTSTYVSWSNAYTSSATTPPAPGIIIPSDYRSRPTSSISIDSRIGGPTGSGGVSYTTYTNATTAVSTILSSIQDGAGTTNSPYTRLGSNPSRTLHSIWHDFDMQYFGWDDFTPGTLSNASSSLTQNALPTNNDLANVSSTISPAITVTIYFDIEYFADKAGDVIISANLRKDSTTGTIVAQLSNYTTTVASAPGKTLLPFAWTFYTNQVLGAWYLMPTQGSYVDSGDGIDAGTYYLADVSIYVKDATITTHQSNTLSYTRTPEVITLIRSA
jgi:hypothetical protein